MGQLGLILWSWIETTRNVVRGRLWVPFLILALVQWAGILFLTQLGSPLIGPIVAPIVRLVAGEAALHYPVFYLALPTVFTRAQFVLDLLFGAWLMGAAFLLFWQADRPADPGSSAFGRATKAYWKLVLLRLPVSAAALVILFWLPGVLAGSNQPSGNTLRLIRYGSVLVGAIIESLFLYASLALLVEGRGIGGAFKRSFGLALRSPVATLAVVLFPSLIQVPVSAVFRRSDTVVRNMSPEVVAWMVVTAVALYSFASFYIVGAGTRVFRARTEMAPRV